MEKMNREIFRAYDIRGLVDVDFDDERVCALGRALGTRFMRAGETRAVVGRDCRASSPGYRDALAAGLADSGVDVIILGMVSTPVFYFAVKHLGATAGAMVTASHNPPEFNGFKLWQGPTTMDSQGIAELYAIVSNEKFEHGSGIISRYDPAPAYHAALNARFHLRRPVRVVVDGGNGNGGPFAVRALRDAGADVIPLYCEPDGAFPNHHPDPTIEKNMHDLKAAVLEHEAELGIGLDGDGDRIGVVDETGRLLPCDELLAVYARDELSRRPGAEIIGDVKCSGRMYDDIRACGGRAVMAPTGHTLMKERMLASEARLAGELSGHMFFRDWYNGLDDGVYAGLRIVSIAAESDVPISRMTAHWPESATTPELRVECPDRVKFIVVDKARAALEAEYEVTDIDGVRFDFPGGWGLVRASNTQPELVMRFEAADEERLEEIRASVEGRVAAWISAESAGRA